MNLDPEFVSQFNKWTDEDYVILLSSASTEDRLKRKTALMNKFKNAVKIYKIDMSKIKAGELLGRLRDLTKFDSILRGSIKDYLANQESDFYRETIWNALGSSPSVERQFNAMALNGEKIQFLLQKMEENPESEVGNFLDDVSQIF